MKLFTPTQAKIAHNYKQDDDIAQIAYLTITLKKLQDSINTENTNFEARMEEQRSLYTVEKARLQKEVKDLEDKIVQKERRLVELLMPIDGLKERAEEVLARSMEEAKSILEREEELAEMQEKLAEKIDIATEKEIRAVELEIQAESRLAGIESEGKMISESHAKLNQEIEDFRELEKSRTILLDERENVILGKEKRNQEYLEARTKELDEKERSLADRRAAFEREFERLSIKK